MGAFETHGDLLTAVLEFGKVHHDAYPVPCPVGIARNRLHGQGTLLNLGCHSFLFLEWGIVVERRAQTLGFKHFEPGAAVLCGCAQASIVRGPRRLDAPTPGRDGRALRRSSSSGSG